MVLSNNEPIECPGCHNPNAHIEINHVFFWKNFYISCHQCRLLKKFSRKQIVDLLIKDIIPPKSV